MDVPTITYEESTFVHGEDHPFCNDPDCPCHNQDAYEEHLEPYLDNGTMTGREALRMYWDQ